MTYVQSTDLPERIRQLSAHFHLLFWAGDTPVQTLKMLEVEIQQLKSLLQGSNYEPNN